MQADFPVIYSVATTQRAGLTADLGPDLQPLFDTVLREIPCPEVEPEAPAFQHSEEHVHEDTATPEIAQDTSAVREALSSPPQS